MKTFNENLSLHINFFDDGILSWKDQHDPFSNSRNIVSLLDMLKFYAGRLFIIIGYLDSLAKLVQTNGEFNLDSKLHNNIKPDIDWLQCTLCKMGLPMSSTIAYRINNHIADNPKVDNQLKNLINELHSRISDELDSRFVFILSMSEKTFYNPDISIFGKEVVNKFGDMNEDIVEAGNCFALGRYTACVFHLMRLIEIAVQKLGDSFGINLTHEKKWQEIINLIRKEIKVKYSKHHPDKIKWDDLLAKLETVKDAWRNPTMHPKATYTEEEARYILNAVEIFMKGLIKIL
jgi:hypothetical protein